LMFGLQQRPSGVERVRTLWDTVGLPLTQTGRQATAAGISTLLAHLKLQWVTWENVLSAVQDRLERYAESPSG
jgi:hypothetical protein